MAGYAIWPFFSKDISRARYVEPVQFSSRLLHDESFLATVDAVLHQMCRGSKNG